MSRHFVKGAAIVGFLWVCIPAATAQIGFEPAVDCLVVETPEQSAAGDFDGDGDLDLAVTADSPDRVHFRFNAGDGSFSSFGDVLLPVSSVPYGIVALDLDDDFDVDLAVTLSHTNFVQLLLNDGTGSFILGKKFAVGTTPRYIIAACFDDDGKNDLAVTNHDSNTVSVLIDFGNADFHDAVDYAAGDEPRGLTPADVDQDGDCDLVVASHDTNELRFLINDAGLFTAGPALEVDSIEVEGVAAGDLDDDGDVDLVTGGDALGANVVAVFLQTAPSVFAGPALYSTNGTGVGFVVLADFDLDTDLDVAVANEVTNDFAVQPNNGDGTFAGALNFQTDSRPVHLLAVDLDANGSPDIVSTNEIGDSISTFLNLDSSGFTDLGFGLAGHQLPVLTGVGTLESNTVTQLTVANGYHHTLAFLIGGLTRMDAKFAGGTMVPSPDVVFPFFLDGNGAAEMNGIWPDGIPAGEAFYLQVWMVDPAGPRNLAATNALEAISKGGSAK
jgi:hypothetical protein